MNVEALRAIFPGFLNMPLYDFENLIEGLEYDNRKYYKEIIKDIKRNSGREYYNGWPYEKNPLKTLDLTPMSFPITDYDLNLTHSIHTRASSWFGIGRWFIAEDCFYKSLSLGIKTNNTTFVFVCLKQICINYLAGYGFSQALKILGAVSEINCYEKQVNFSEDYLTLELMALAHLEEWDRITSKLSFIEHPKSLAVNINDTIVEVYRYLNQYYDFLPKLERWSKLWKKTNAIISR